MEDKVSKSKSMKVQALRAAFPLTIPIMAGFLFLGTTYGIYMRLSGFSFWYPALISLLVFGGSLQFVLVPLLLAPFAPLETLILALFLQARHLFYGISMLDKYKGTGWKKFYLIYGMCDEQNLASDRVMQKCRMKYEGKLRSHYVRKDGSRGDVCLFGLLRGEWEALKSSGVIR